VPEARGTRRRRRAPGRTRAPSSGSPRAAALNEQQHPGREEGALPGTGRRGDRGSGPGQRGRARRASGRYCPVSTGAARRRTRLGEGGHGSTPPARPIRSSRRSEDTPDPRTRATGTATARADPPRPATWRVRPLRRPPRGDDPAPAATGGASPARRGRPPGRPAAPPPPAPQHRSTACPCTRAAPAAPRVPARGQHRTTTCDTTRTTRRTPTRSRATDPAVAGPTDPPTDPKVTQPCPAPRSNPRPSSRCP